MRKKFLATAATLAAVVMLTACGNNVNGGDVTATQTPAPTEAPTATPTPAPTEAPKVDHQQMVNNMYQAVVEAYGGMYHPDMQVQNEAFFMQDTLKLDASWYDAAIVEVPMMSANVDTFAVLHATEGNLENVKNAFLAYQDYLINGTMQYPMNVPKVQASIVEVIDDQYVVFSILSGLAWVDEFEDIENEEVLTQQIAAYKESSRLAVEIVAGVASGEIVVAPWTEIDLIRNTIAKVYGETYLPSMKVSADKEYLATYLQDTLKIDPAWVSEALIEVPMIGAHADALFIIDASEGNDENVMNAFKAYKDYLVNESHQYPMNEARVQTATIEKIGDYTCFFILGGPLDEALWADYGITTEEQLLEHYTNTNAWAVDAVKGYLGIWE